MPKPTISIVIPSYNEATYIDRLLEALTRQKYKDFEVIVSDAQSGDGTDKVVQSFSDKLNIKLVKNPPEGPAIGRNQGAAKAAGEWLLFLDADVDIDDADFLHTMLQESTRRNLKVASANIKLRERGLGDRFGLWLHHGYLRLLSHTKHPVAPGFCIFTLRQVFEANSGFDKNLWLAEDYDYVSRAGRGSFAFIDSTYYYVDLRRFSEGGKFKVYLLSIWYEIYRFTHGFKIAGDPFNYKFGHHEERKK